MENEKLKILIVCSKNSGKIAPFITDQAELLQREGCVVDFFTIEGKGLKGYLKNRAKLIEKIKREQPNIIHAHYGLSGLLANLQRRVPVVTSYHGSDINYKKVLIFSKISMFLSRFNIFVSKKNIKTAKPRKNYALIPCGVDLQVFKPMDKSECREKFGFKSDEKLVLFASSFDNEVKNPALAQAALALLENVKLIELKGYNRQQVSELMNAVDAVLLTSFSEGSPQFIKEAMACGCPIVAVDVGDVREITANIEGCYVANACTKEEIAENLKQALTFGKKTQGRARITALGMDNTVIANKLKEIYKKIDNK